MKPIDTRRLVLRRLSPDELRAVYPQLVREEEGDDAPPEYIEHEVAVDTGWALHPLGAHFGRLAVILKSEQRVIGSATLHPAFCTAADHRTMQTGIAHSTLEVETGYSLSQLYRGQGYITEAVDALLRYAFDDLKLSRVIAISSIDNAPSIRVMERAGMRVFHEAGTDRIIGVSERP